MSASLGFADFGHDTTMNMHCNQYLQGRAAVMFDVGANTGANSLPLAEKYPEAHFYAFEPTPQLAERLRSLAPPNYTVIQKAVDEVTGRKVFNVSGVDDWGRSSLNEFRSESAKAFGAAARLNVVTHVVEVDCVRLEDFCRERGITSIQYLHVDTQGSDMCVLKSLGEYLRALQAGVVEVARNLDTRLYHQSPTRSQMAEYLFDNGFQIELCEPNDGYNAEQNIYFTRVGRPLSRREFNWRYYRAIMIGWRRRLKSRVIAKVARLLSKLRVVAI